MPSSHFLRWRRRERGRRANMLTNGLSRVVPTHIHFGEEEIPLRGDGSIQNLLDR